MTHHNGFARAGPAPTVRRLPVLAVLLASVLAGCAAVPGLSGTGPCADLSTAGDEYDRATVTVSATNGTTLGTVDARVADTPRERCVGLSETASLAPDEGMVFVFGGVADRTFVMRDMAFPLDIIFVGEDRRVTRVVSAPTEEPPTPGTRPGPGWSSRCHAAGRPSTASGPGPA